jgi:hypothetical protein
MRKLLLTCAIILVDLSAGYARGMHCIVAANHTLGKPLCI